MTRVYIRKGEHRVNTQTQREEDQVMIGGETGIRKLQAKNLKDCQQPSEAKRVMEGTNPAPILLSYLWPKR